MEAEVKIFNDLIDSVIKNSCNNEANITDVVLWAESWRQEMNQARSYARCREELKNKEAISFEAWLEINYTMNDGIYLSKQADQSAWYTIREVRKQYNIEFNL